MEYFMYFDIDELNIIEKHLQSYVDRKQYELDLILSIIDDIKTEREARKA